MTERINPRVLKGFRDSLPDTEKTRKGLIGILEDSFESFGFLPIDTPALEYEEVLLGKGGGETDKQVYRFVDHGKREVALRFDLTVPFARFMATHVEEIGLPFKRYHIGKVWRGENTQRGRYREFVQCDFDIVGADSPASDFEVISMIRRSLMRLGVDSFKIHISHRALLDQLLTYLNLSSEKEEILRGLDKLGKIGLEGVKKLLLPVTGGERWKELKEFISAEGTPSAVVDRVSEKLGSDSAGVVRLKEIIQLAEESGMGRGIVLDTSITRGLDYYTGVVFETFLDELPGIGSICSGGRYNNLTGLYSDREMPGVGASVGLDRLIAALQVLEQLPDVSGSADLLILNMSESLAGYYFSMADRIREFGVRVEVFLEAKKLGRQFQYAERRGIPYGLLIGDEEYANGAFTLKDLRSRETFRLDSLNALVKKL